MHSIDRLLCIASSIRVGIKKVDANSKIRMDICASRDVLLNPWFPKLIAFVYCQMRATQPLRILEQG
jgi:hypothetical protein